MLLTCFWPSIPCLLSYAGMFKSDLFFWSSWSIIPCVSYNFVDYFLGGVFDSACLLCMSMILFLVRDSVCLVSYAGMLMTSFLAFDSACLPCMSMIFFVVRSSVCRGVYVDVFFFLVFDSVVSVAWRCNSWGAQISQELTEFANEDRTEELRRRLQQHPAGYVDDATRA